MNAVCKHCGKAIYQMRPHSYAGRTAVQPFWEHSGGSRNCPGKRTKAEPR